MSDNGLTGPPGGSAVAPTGPVVGRVIGTEDATPLEFWVAVAPDAYLQLDDVVALERILPDGQHVRIYGLVSQVRARHEGARFDSDVFLIADGILPAEVSEAALGHRHPVRARGVRPAAARRTGAQSDRRRARRGPLLRRDGQEAARPASPVTTNRCT